jgi:hypothetical protein
MQENTIQEGELIVKDFKLQSATNLGISCFESSGQKPGAATQLSLRRSRIE